MITCSVPGCDRTTRSRSATLCDAHYFREYRTGSAGTALIKTGREPCMVPGCTRKHHAHGYCQLHGRRVAKGGSPEFIGSQAWQMNPAWRGDAIGYVSAHERVASARGPARERQCAHCGAGAQHWAYTHDDPKELKTPEGIPYSADPARYLPLCVPCHKRFDLGRPACSRCNSETGAALKGVAR
jgi:hypothetical protein